MLFNNLYVTFSNYVAINEVVFERCGPHSPGMAAHSVNYLTISNCIARNNLHSGILVFLSDYITINKCTFENNNSTNDYISTDNLDPGESRYAGGLSIIWREFNLPGFANVINCTFINNTASLSELNVNDTRPSLYIPQGHGGAITAHFDNTNNHVILIENSKVLKNEARFNGGGAFFTFYNKSSGNSIIVRKTVFEGNKCKDGTGGGISMSTFYKANKNQLLVEDTVFNSNTATVGGGGCSINIQDQLTLQDDQAFSNVGSFDNCTFEENFSPEGGSAVSLVSNARVNQALATTNFIDCFFLHNEANGDDGSLMSFRFPVAFSGHNSFTNNSGGGVSLIQTRVDMCGSLMFEGNSAGNGGGLALLGESVMHLLRNADITFVGNSANNRGGALLVYTSSVSSDISIGDLFNSQCFIQYDLHNHSPSLPPTKWNVSLSFINNTARSNGAAIYATRLDRCKYVPTLNTSGASTIREKSIFAVSHIFYFSGNRVTEPRTTRTNEDIATAPTSFVVSPEAVTGAPGEIIHFNLEVFDQAGNHRRAIWGLHENSLIQAHTRSLDYNILQSGGDNYMYSVQSSPGETYDNCSKDETLHVSRIDFNLQELLAGEIVNSPIANVSVTCCHPGYVFNRTGTGKCEYDRTNKVTLRGDANNRYVYIEPEHYAEVRNGTIVSAVILPTFQHCTKQGTLRGCLFKYDKPHEQCAGGRTGFLCGECPANQSLDLALRTCKECTAGDAIVVAVWGFFFMLFCILVLLFNVGVPNDLKGVFFFVQVVGFVYQLGSSDITWDFHLARILGFSLYLPQSLCPYPGYSALVTASFGLIPSILALIIIVVYVICANFICVHSSANFIQRLSNRTCFEGIWLLCLLTVKFTADSAFVLLRCQKVTGIHGEFVHFYDGSIQCFDQSGPHLVFEIVALVLAALVSACPVIILIISYKRFKHTQAFTDVLTNDIKVSCRWWSCFDLLRRLSFVVVAFLMNYIQPDFNQLALFALGLIIFFTFACAQPYKSRRANLIEALVLLDLLMLTSLFLNTEDRTRNAVDQFTALLLVLPFLFGLLYVLLMIIKTIWKRWSPTSFMEFQSYVQHLVLKGEWKGAEKTGASRDLETIIDVSTTRTGTVVEAELERTECTERINYTAYREELLASNVL